MNALVSLAARLVPDDWRAAVLRDLEDEAADRHGRVWICWQILRVGTRARLSFGGDAMRADLFEAWRALCAAPAIAIVAVLSIAFGIGANTAIFSVLDSLVLKTLPVRAPEQLFLLGHGNPWWTNPLWEQIRARQHTLFGGAFAYGSGRFALTTRGPSAMIDGAYVSGDMFDVLGLTPARGRFFTDADDRRGGGPAGPVVVVSHDFWQQHFHGSDDVVGQHVRIAHVPFTIVGVAPRDFSGFEKGQAPQVFVPLGAEPLIRGSESTLDSRLSWWLRIVVRLEPGQSTQAATAALQDVQPRIRAATLPPPDVPAAQVALYLRGPFSLSPAARGGRPVAGGRLVTPLTAMLVVVGLVLLVACVNVANLLLARAAARRQELSVRLALGSSRGRLARQLVMESLLLSTTGGILGFALAQVGSRLLVRGLAPGTTLFLDLAIDWRVFAFAAAITLVTTIVFSVGPLLAATRVTPAEAITSDGRRLVGDRSAGRRSLLVVAQVALSLVPVAAAGLFIHSFAALVNAPLGVTSNPVLRAAVSVANIAPSDRQALFDRVQQAAAAVPGVSRTAISLVAPLRGEGWNSLVEITDDATARRDVPRSDFDGPGNGIPGGSATRPRPDISWINGVTPGWFDVYGMHMVIGRDFTADDRVDAPHVAIVNETFRRTFFGGRSPLGRSVSGGLDGRPFAKVPFTIVGVVSDAAYRSIREGMVPTVYVPLAQATAPGAWTSFTPVMSIAAARPPATGLRRDLAEALARVGPGATLLPPALDDAIRGATAPERTVAVLSGLFGALALFLAAIGVYGVTSYAVDRRRAELGVRMTLGANASDVVGLVLGRVGWLIVFGVVAGAALAFWAARFVSASLLFGVDARDTQAFIGAAVVLGAVGVFAGWLPARRAARIDPTQVLRES